MSKYTWGGNPCVRCGEPMGEESHPCYYCGEPLIASHIKVCDNCKFEPCSKCGKCFCNGTEAEQVSLRVLRDKYCCNSFYFNKGFDWKRDKWLLIYVPNFVKALDNCRRIRNV